jgi:hypothetical protein
MNIHWISFFEGIVASMLAAWFVKIFSDGILPYFQRVLYKQIETDGDWIVRHTADPVDGDGLESLWTLRSSLKQAGQTISGTAHATCIRGSSNGKQVSYKVRGRISNGVVDMTFIEASASSRNRSVFLLELIGDGACLTGYRLFLGRQNNEIRAIRCEWARLQGRSTCGTA